MSRTTNEAAGGLPQSAEFRQVDPDLSPALRRAASVRSGTSKAADWRAQLPRLGPLSLPLLPCGAGAEKKAPIDSSNGQLMEGWTHARFDVDQILAMNGVVRSVGTRTGSDAQGLIAFDIDGETALELAIREGCDPQQARTWQIHRDTDPCRLKVCWWLTAEQRQQVPELCKKAITKPKAKAPDGTVIKAHALEVFHHPGKQVVVLGEHPSSGGNYLWPAGLGPEQLAPIPPQWWALALKIEAGELGINPGPAPAPRASKGSKSSRREWQSLNPCPICGRDSTGYCSRHRDDGTIRCFHGSTFSPEARHGLLRVGQTITGSDGITYGYCGSQQQSNGDPFATFRVHKPRAPRTPDFDGFTVHDSQPSAGPARFTPRAGSTAKWGKRRISHTRAMRCFDRCVQVLAARERNSLTRRARLLRAARALELHRDINRQEISQRVLEAKDQHQGNTYRGLTAEDRLAMEWPDVEWLVPNLLPANDLSIIGGRPKVGKTAFAMAVAAAVLTGCSVAGCSRPDTTRPVIVISDDASDADTKQALTELAIFDHPQLIWSRHFRLTESDLDQLLVDIRQHPGAVVILDSLRSVSRTLQHGENDPEIGAVIYDLKEAVMAAGGSLLLIHHCNKAEGLAGVEALSGHNAISGAANTVITLHHVEDGNGKPDKEATQRRLYREGRSGQMLDWVISRTAGTGTFHQVSTWANWQEQIKEAQEQAKKEGRRTDTQREALELLEQHAGEWLTLRQVVEGLGLPWSERGAGPEPARVRRALDRLTQEEAIRKVRSGHDYTFSANEGGHSECQQRQQRQHPCSASDLGVDTSVSTVSTASAPLRRLAADSVDTACQHPDPLPPLAADAVDTVDAVGHPPLVSELPPHPHLATPELQLLLLKLRRLHGANPAVLVNLLPPEVAGKATGAQVRATLEWIDRQPDDFDGEELAA